MPQLLQPLDEWTRETMRVETIQEVGTQLDILGVDPLPEDARATPVGSLGG